MKLHLPNRLRKALLACLALATPALTSTLATGSTLLAGFCSFSTLRAEDTEPEEVPTPSDPTKKMPGSWNNLQGEQLKSFDSTKDITRNDEGNWSFGDSSTVDKGKMYFVWDTTANGYTLKFFNNKDVLEAWKTSTGYSGDTFTIDYQNKFGTGGTGTVNHGLRMKRDSGKSEDAGFGFELTSGNDLSITNTTAGAATLHVAKNTSRDSITGVFYEKTNGTQIDGSTTSSGRFFSGIDDANGGYAGAAISVATGANVNAITADFINNYLKSGQDDHGAAIYVDYNAKVGTIKGNFVGNHIESDRKVVGGAILNWGKIGDLQGTFIGNYLATADKSGPVGGVIANGAEAFSKDSYESKGENGSGNAYSVIERLGGYFIGNYATTNGAHKDTIGGTIANYGRIGEITGVFIGNFAYSDNTANSGVVRNYSRNNGTDTRVAVIGASDDVWKKASSEKLAELKKKAVISGVFIGNYAQGTDGDGYGGVMRNNGEIRGAIDGIFVGNYAVTEGNNIADGKLDKSNQNGNYTSYGNAGNYDYYKVGSSGLSRQDRAMAYGGAIYNEVKIDPESTGAAGQVAIGDIRGGFYDNYVSSTYGEAFGGAIFNQDASIENITVDVFSGNYAVSDYYVARGGALYDNKDGAAFLAQIGTIGTLNKKTGFHYNYAKGKMAQGGAIVVANGATAENVYANFFGNYTISAVNDNENQYYADNIQNRNASVIEGDRDNLLSQLEKSGLHPIAQGGAIYVTGGSTMDNIAGNFGYNFARTTGIGYSGKSAKAAGKTVAASNAYHYAQGGAIYVDEGNTKSITGEFFGNYVETLGLIHEANIMAKAQGGAIYLNAGTMEEVAGNFTDNEAAVYSRGDANQEVSGGAIYVASGATMKTISGEFISNNKAVSSTLQDRDNKTRGTFTEDNKHEANTDLHKVTVQGGAIYVDAATVSSIKVSNITNNEALSKASGYQEEMVQGGAIYVNAGGTIGNVGSSNTYARISENHVQADGKGTALTTQTAQGGAIFLSKQAKADNIYTSGITSNSVTVGWDEATNNNAKVKRTAQGGAIYVAEGGAIADISAYYTDEQGKPAGVSSFYENKVTVTGGNAENKATLLAQGGAIYVDGALADGTDTQAESTAESAKIDNIIASFTNNSVDTTKATGNLTEDLQGGAIYLNNGANIGNIGRDGTTDPQNGGDVYVSISNNTLHAGGAGNHLTEQTAQGGAIFLSEGAVMGKVFANFANNAITADFGDSTAVETRTVQGGAIYLNKGASGGDIWSLQGENSGFYKNSITVNGDQSGNNTTIWVQGGAIYVNKEAHIGSIRTNLVGNTATNSASGATTERVGGGAIYVADQGYIGNIGHKAADETDEYYLAEIKDNSVTASGKGTNLTTQMARGGAILVEGKNQQQGYSIMNIYTSGITNNTVTADLDETLNAKELKRTARGGAIYVATGGTIEDIGAYEVTNGEFSPERAAAFANNKVTVTGGNIDNKATLDAQGGALYVDDGATVQNVVASFTGNEVNTSAAEGNSTETVQGGAIFVNQKASLQNIGRNGEKDDRGWALVDITGNKLIAGGKGSNLTEQTVQGGAIFASTSPDGANNTSIGNIYASSISRNTITARADGSTKLTTRDIMGGAIYLYENADMENIGHESKPLVDISANTITVTDGNESNKTALTTGGGAIFAGEEAKIGDIYASFTKNGIDTSAANGNASETLQGGAIHLSGGAEAGQIGISAEKAAQVEGNYLIAGGKGNNLKEQTVQGGAFYLGEMNGEYGKMGDIYADFKGNKITADADAINLLKNRTIQGGAIYLKDDSKIASITEAGDLVVQAQQPQLSTKELAKLLMDSILHPVAAPIAAPENEHGFVGNTITVTGGADGGTAELLAQGGALYLAGGAKIGPDKTPGKEEKDVSVIQASFIGNTITTKGDTEKGTKDATGNSIERVAGGAIYVAGGAKIEGHIGSENHIVSIKNNGLTATGHGSELEQQWARGGAIYVGYEKGYGSGEIKDIYADITDNSIHISADSSGNEDKLTMRLAKGGALYVADGGMIGAIYQSEKGEGITRNTITVAGGNKENSTELQAMGGALFVSNGARVDGVMASFTGNSVDTFDATGNKTETVGGGAIYLDQKASVEAIGDENNKVEISNNSLTAGGNGDHLTSQKVQGGAIYASSQPDDHTKDSIGAIYADITSNTITAGVGDSTEVTERTIQGGAIYLDKEGAITSITKKKGGITENSITVTGGNSENAALTVQGGAIYVASKSSIGEINAHFTSNTITNDGTKNDSSLAQGGAIYVANEGKLDDIYGSFILNTIDSATNDLDAANASSLAQGGAIYVAGGGQIQDIGSKGTLVDFEENHVFIGKNAVKNGTAANMAKKHAMGGAIYLSEDDDGSGKLKDVYANFKDNYAKLEENGNTYVDARAYGGAVFVSEKSEIGNIKGDFERNYAMTSGTQGNGSKDLVHGGAIDVANDGTAGEIIGNFIGNYVENSNKKVDAANAADMLNDDIYATDVHAKGGAIYLAQGGSIDTIGSGGSMFKQNYAAGSGQVRGGAILVTNAYVGEIAGTFYANYAKGDESLATFGGGIRFDDSVLVRLESNFYNNHTTGTGGALSLTKAGVIYEITGDFKGNYSALNGGGVEALGAIGLRGYAVTKDGEAPASDFSNVDRLVDGKNLETKRDSTDTILGAAYRNKEGRNEYDGSFTGGFVNSNFLYNTVQAEKTAGDLTKQYLKDNDIKSQYYRGAGIYTDRDLFITANEKQEVIMSGNKIEKDGGEKVRSAIYVDNKEKRDTTDDYESIIVYLVAQDHAVLRIDDNIRGHEASPDGLVVRLRGYADKHYKDDPYDPSGLIILNNRVEKTYTVMDDVTLYIGYKPHTYIDQSYFETYTIDSLYKNKYDDAKIGDEKYQNIIMNGQKSTYLDVAGTASRDGKTFMRSQRDDTDVNKIEFHQSDIFRDSFMSVRSGTVALTESTYARHDGAKPGKKFTDMDSTEVYTEYLFGGLIAYGADYNYGIYGTNDTKATDGRDKAVADLYTGSSMTDAGNYGSQQYPYRHGSDDGRYATFEFGMSFDEKNLYDLALANRYYYRDMNGNPTEKSFWVDEKGEKHGYADYMLNGERVHVEHRMAKSDMLTVFAVWDDKKGDVDWEKAARGRVTLNGLTVNNLMTDYYGYLMSTNKSVGGPQTDDTLENGKDSGVLLEGDGFNRDLYVQLINYMLVDDKGKWVEDQEALNSFYAKFDEAEVEDNLNNGYHLLRLSDHFNLIHNASWAMKGSDILADEIELATTVTKDDSLHIVNWRDHLAEWAEHEASWDGEKTGDAKDDDGNTITDADGKPVQEPKETAGLYTGKKHFVLDQSVYYLNRNINIEANPTTKNYAPTGAQMWGQYLTIEGTSKNKQLDLQKNNMLSLVIPDQQVRLQSFTLTNVKDDARVSAGLIQNEGDLILDTMWMEKSLTINNTGMNYTGKKHGKELNNRSFTLDNRLTVTGVMDIDFTITTLDSEKTGKHGKLFINHSTEVLNRALPGWVDPEPEAPTTPEPDTDVTEPDTDEPDTTEPDTTLPDTGDLTPEAGGGLAGGDTPAGAAMGGVSALDDSIPADTVTDNTTTGGGATEPATKGDKVLSESIVHITGVVEHQDVTHQGEDQMELGNETLTYNDTGEEQKLGTWYIKTGKRDARTHVRETFTSNTYLETTLDDLRTATPQFLAFRDNSLTMEGGAFNLGTMYKHRLPLRYFYVNGGSVFVKHSTINLKDERMGGIDAKDGDAKYAGDFEDTKGKNTSGTGDGLIWLQGFTIEDTSEKFLVHVKFVDDGVGNAVKDGMGIANGAQKSNMRLMRDGKRKYIWQVTYNDSRAENDYEEVYKGKTGVKGMYTFYRLGFTPESQEGPVTDMTGSYVTMMQVYNYSFQHADLYSTNIAAAREQQLYADHYSAVDVKGKGSVAPVEDTCPPSTAGLRNGLWLHTYASTETMPLRNGPEVRLNMYGGLVGGDSALKEHRNGWASVWSLYGGYVGSTQKYDDVRIRQNGAALGLTGTFYKKKFYTALTASVGVASATANSFDCKDDFDLIMGGIASRSGYSFEFGNGRYILQPNLMLSYTLFNTCDYTNAYGSRVTAKPTGLLQINPFVKFIKNTDCTWKPYAKLGLVYNALGKTKYTFDGTSLPSMSVKPYVEYSIGAQRTWRDRYTLYAEVTGRNGGRNGAEASAGIRIAW